MTMLWREKDVSLRILWKIIPEDLSAGFFLLFRSLLYAAIRNQEVQGLTKSYLHFGDHEPQ